MSKQHLFQPLFNNQSGKCQGCGNKLDPNNRYMIEIDRIIPGAQGGKYEISNCQLLCLPCHWNKSGNKPNSPNPEIASAYRQFKAMQMEAGDLNRKIKAYEGEIKGKSRSPYFTDSFLDALKTYKDEFEKEAEGLEKELKRLVRAHPTWKGLFKGSPGISEMTAAFLLSRVDIRKNDTPSSLWSFLGFVPRKDKGGNSVYNPGKGADLKSPIYVALFPSLIRKNSLYRQDYDMFKARLLNEGKTRNRVTKLWLSHLWYNWRTFEELSTVTPWAQANGHQTFIPSKDRGWKF